MPTPSADAPPAPDRLSAAVAAVLDRRLDRASTAPVAVGFSGGGDSLALLLAALDWARIVGRPVLALTVDHGLQPDSRAWAAAAADAARRAGAAARILAWTGPKPAAGIPAAARLARHRLLANAAREAGASVVLLGHTADDRAEEAVIRESDAPAIGRLREWSPSPVWPDGRGVFLLRPLLDQRRADLRDGLRRRGHTWFDDPANDDLRYARARARRSLSFSGGGAQGLGPEEPAAPPDRSTDPASASGPRVSAALRPRMTEWEMTVDGRVLLSRADLSPTLLSAALLCAAGTDRPPRSLQLDRLLDRLNGDRPVDATLAGARLVAAGETGETVQIGRDAGERFRGGLTPIPLAVGTPTVWDGRFEIVADAPGLGVGPLGGAMGRLPPAERNSLKAFPAWARGALPALTDDTGGARLPRPWGQGPAEVHGLAAARLTAFLGGADDERSLARQADAVDSAASFRLS